MGGEKAFPTFWSLKNSGSPPRGRGKVCCSSIALICAGITPAWAGKRGWMRATEITRKDHPRVGGEKGSVPAIAHNPAGSPPRGRGKGFLARLPPFFTGITPAWAGKSARYPAQGSACWDHPRVGGEKWGNKNQHFGAKGSPPRGRGKVLAPAPTWQSPRITPAWAGKRVRRPSWSYGGGDHPRVGGEKQGY